MHEDHMLSGGAASIQDDATFVDSDLLDAAVNDSAHAAMFATRFGQELVHIPGLGWKFYNGSFWESKGDNEARLRAGKIIELRRNAFTRRGISSAEDKQKLRRLENCGNCRVLASVVKFAADRLAMGADRFDKHPKLLNVANGIVDLETGILHPHDPQKYLTRSTGVAYDSDARSELWEKTIFEIADGDESLARFLQVTAGIAATGDTSIQKFFYFFGQGANGKSLITALWAAALGGFGESGYAARLPSALISGRRAPTADKPSPSLLTLRGRRLAIFDEQSGDAPFNDQLIKSLSGGDAVTARAPFRMPVTFHPEFTMIGVGNHKPALNASDYGIWRRMLLVPFRRTFEPSRLGEILHGELPAVLAWMVRGAMQFYRGGLDIPDVAVQEAEEYQAEVDSVRGWLREKADISDPNAETSGKDLFNSYCARCEERRESAGTHNAFSRRLQEVRAFKKRESSGKVLWAGIKLRDQQS